LEAEPSSSEAFSATWPLSTVYAYLFVAVCGLLNLYLIGVLPALLFPLLAFLLADRTFKN